MVEVFIALAKLDDSIIAGIDEIGRCCLWYSKTTKFKTNEILSWDRKGIRYINDLLKENGEIMTIEELVETYGIRRAAFDYQTLIYRLSSEWKKINKLKEANPIIRPTISLILMPKRGDKHI